MGIIAERLDIDRGNRPPDVVEQRRCVGQELADELADEGVRLDSSRYFAMSMSVANERLLAAVAVELGGAIQTTPTTVRTLGSWAVCSVTKRKMPQRTTTTIPHKQPRRSQRTSLNRGATHGTMQRNTRNPLWNVWRRWTRLFFLLYNCATTIPSVTIKFINSRDPHHDVQRT